MKLIPILLCAGAMMAQTPTSAPKTDAIDVPPISEEYGNPGNYWCDMGDCHWQDGSSDFYGNPPQRRTRLTCADKTRFLMTAEDGSKHCIALGKPSPQTGAGK